MSLWEWVKADYSNFKTTATLFGALLFILGIVAKTFFSEWIKSPFSKKLEGFKTELVQKIEGVKVQNQKDFFNYETFHSVKFQKSPELYRLVLLSLSKINSYQGAQEVVLIENLHVDDVLLYVEDLNLKPSMLSDIKANWHTEKDTLINSIRHAENNQRYNQSVDMWNEANNYRINNELFFSDEVTNQTRDLLKKMSDILLLYKPFMFGTEHSIKMLPIYWDELDKMLPVWKLLMKNEVAKDRYTENTPA